jgi:arylsulfatase A-like enzyme
MRYTPRLPFILSGLTAVFLCLWALVNSLAAASIPTLTPDTDQPHIIFIVVDAVRADHLSGAGYARPTTPNVDTRLVTPGALFADVTSASSWTYPANAAMLTSHTPRRIGVDWASHTGSIPESQTMLAEYLHDAGYATAGFISAYWMQEKFGFDQGFDAYTFTAENRAANINQLAMEWLDINWQPPKSDSQPLFLYLYYFDPHTYYTPPPPYDIMYDNTYTGTLTGEVYMHGQQVVSGDIVPTERDIEHLIALYDGEITYWDAQFGQMLDFLDGKGLLQNSIIVLTSDHGQMFGEQGKWVHHNSLYEEVLRVPLVLRYPGVITPGTVITAPVHHMDVTPTILDLLGLPAPEQMEGTSLLPLLQGQPAPASRPLYSEMNTVPGPDHPAAWISPATDLYAVRQDSWKYIHALGSRGDDELRQVGPISIYEGENMIVQEPETAAAYYQNVIDWFALPTQFLYLPFVDDETAGQ